MSPRLSAARCVEPGCDEPVVAIHDAADICWCMRHFAERFGPRIKPPD